MKVSAAAATGREKGIFRDEIVSVTTRGLRRGRGAAHRHRQRDTILRPETTLEGLAKLKPAFNPKGTVTAGNCLSAHRRRRRGGGDE